jgi:hypothetical protein
MVYALYDLKGNSDPNQRHETAIAPSFPGVSSPTPRIGSSGQSA